MSQPAVEFKNVVKEFEGSRVVDQVNLAIEPGEFFTLLGPSGSGKTTMLRMIAGFESPTSGEVFINGQENTLLRPNDRPVNTVFQDYALFPHMDVMENIEFGLKVHGVEKTTRRDRATQALEMVQLSGLGSRRPSQLSGGQRQRVALARAIVNEPKVLLLDEPLGALDLKLRQEMQSELKRIHKDVGITFIYVTHDQEEAMSMSDRIAIVRGGQIEQLATPAEIYNHPKSVFVATFIGSSNIITDGGRSYSVRPERIQISASSSEAGQRSGNIEEVVFLGMNIRVVMRSDSGEHLHAEYLNTPAAATYSPGQRVTFAWAKADAVLLEDALV
jgi:ABC-type Fe3+/spermidine/putrescine transport system ATPase subunit